MIHHDLHKTGRGGGLDFLTRQPMLDVALPGSRLVFPVASSAPSLVVSGARETARKETLSNSDLAGVDANVVVMTSISPAAQKAERRLGQPVHTRPCPDRQRPPEYRIWQRLMRVQPLVIIASGPCSQS